MNGENTKLNWSFTRTGCQLDGQDPPSHYLMGTTGFPLRYNSWNITLAIQLHLVCSYATTATGLHGVVLNQAQRQLYLNHLLQTSTLLELSCLLYTNIAPQVRIKT